MTNRWRVVFRRVRTDEDGREWAPTTERIYVGPDAALEAMQDARHLWEQQGRWAPPNRRVVTWVEPVTDDYPPLYP